MKKIIVIILMLPMFVFSQNRIEDNENYAKINLKDGRIIECVIQNLNDKSITYYMLDRGWSKNNFQGFN